MMDIIGNLLPDPAHFYVTGYWIAFFAALVETTIGIGLIIPGSTIILILGALSARGSFDAYDLIWFAATGAILGDNIKIETNSVALDKVEINCANLKVKTLESNIKILKIQSSNLKGLIDYNENNSNINISSNNSDLTINKLKFDGELSIRANNSNYNNCIYGDKNLGTFIANFNNSNITIN